MPQGELDFVWNGQRHRLYDDGSLYTLLDDGGAVRLRDGHGPTSYVLRTMFARNAALEAELAAAKAECERVTQCLSRANEQAEHFEREWYLRGDEIDTIRAEIETLKKQAAAAKASEDTLDKALEACMAEAAKAGDKYCTHAPDGQLDLAYHEVIQEIVNDFVAAKAKIFELHDALAKGAGVEDGGIWEDRAFAAEYERNALRAENESLREQLAAAKACYDAASGDREDLLRAHEKTSADMSSEIDELRAEVESLRKQVAEAHVSACNDGVSTLKQRGASTSEGNVKFI